MKRLENALKTLACTIWCHRAAYAGLSAVYFAGCMGWVDKDTVAHMATGLYIALTAQRH